MEPAIITAIAKIVAPVLPIVIKAIQGALNKRKVRERDIATLKFQLSYIQGIILDTREIIRSAENPSSRLQSWFRNLSCLAYDIEDLIAGHKAKTMTGAKLNGKITIILNLVNSVQSCPEFMKIPNEASHQSTASSSTASTQIIPSNQDMEKDFPLADLVGKEDHLRELLNLVRRPDSTDNDLSLKVMVISVVGFGGIGETKLCSRVYKDVKKHSKFSLYASVSAAGKDGSMILEDIIQQFDKQEGPQDGFLQRMVQTIRGDANDQIHHLSRYLQRKRYFIMVDDVESEGLVKFIASVFPDNYMGSRIIMGMVTIVGKDAERCDGHMSKMWPLQDERSVTWFLNKAEHRSTFSKLPEQDYSSSSLQKICDGVPLALVSVREVRRGSTPTAAVEEACSELRRVEIDRWPHRMPVVLPHSFNSLHIRGVESCQNQYIPYLQACLLYFTMFPGGNVKRGSLIRRWQAEGIEFGGSNQAVETMKTLVDRNFVWPLHVSMNQHQHAKICQPPGVVLDYISRMSEMEGFIMKSCPSEDLTPNYSRRLCLHPPKEGTPEPLVITNRSVPPRLRTLALSWGQQEACRIAECEQLRVLDLESYPGLDATQLEEICKKLKLLKYLSLLPDNITEVPSSISNLHELETLEFGNVKDKAKNKDGIVRVPIDVFSLPRLKHLIGKFELIDKLYGIPNRIFTVVFPTPKAIRESNLERLSGFVTRRGQGFPSLMCHMKKLKKVKIWFYADADAKYIEDYLPDAITKFLKNGKGPHSLSLDFQDCPSSRQLVLHSLATASGELYSLKLSGDVLSKIDLFVITDKNIKLTGITKLGLCWKEITMDAIFLNELSNLNLLKYLKLDAETIKAEDKKYPPKIVIETSHMKNLEQMCLVAKQTLADIEINDTALQNLVSLHLISGDINYSPSTNLICAANGQVGTPLENIMEVALNITMPEDSKNHWREAARNHRKTPKILFIEHPHRAG